MRICPKCGYVDPICWKPNSITPEVSYSYMSALKLLEPQVYEGAGYFKTGQVFQIGVYVYWKTRYRKDRHNPEQTIRRVWVEDFKKIGKKGHPMEDRSVWRQVKLEID